MRTNTCIAFLVLVCLGLSSLAAQGQREAQIRERTAPQAHTAAEGSAIQAMQAPLLGFVYSAERSELRPILGLPGASLFGRPMSLPAGVTGIYVAPRQNYALLAGRVVGSIGLMTFQGAEEGRVAAICGAISRPDLIAFSPSGNSAVLYSRDAEQLQVLTGLPSAPHLARVVASSELPDELRFLAIADDGSTLLEGTVRSAIYLLPEGGSPKLLYSAADLGGMVFTPRTSNVLVFDRGAGTLFLLQEVGSASSYVPIAEGLTGVAGNALLQVNGGSAVLVGTNTSSAWQIDLASLEVQSTRLPVTPHMLQPLQTSGKFLLFYKAGRPGWILDTSGEAGVVSFVPASTEPRLNPRHVPLSSRDGELSDKSQQPGLVNPIVIGSACGESSQKAGAKRPLSQSLD